MGETQNNTSWLWKLNTLNSESETKMR